MGRRRPEILLLLLALVSLGHTHYSILSPYDRTSRDSGHALAAMRLCEPASPPIDSVAALAEQRHLHALIDAAKAKAKADLSRAGVMLMNATDAISRAKAAAAVKEASDEYLVAAAAEVGAARMREQQKELALQQANPYIRPPPLESAPNDLLPVVVPIHAPKFLYLCRLVVSATNSSVAIMPVFNGDAGLREWDHRHGQTLLAAGRRWWPVVLSTGAVPPCNNRTCVPRTVAIKKVRALHRVFSQTGSRHAVAMDAESEVMSQTIRWEPFVAQWERDRVVLGAGLDTRLHKAELWKKTLIVNHSCSSLGYPAIEGYPHFIDAPMYSRSDFFEFEAKLDSTGLFFQKLLYAYDTVAYACWKVRSAEAWRLVVDKEVKSLELVRGPDRCEAEQQRFPGHRFMWTRSTNCSSSLFRFHLDRE